MTTHDPRLGLQVADALCRTSFFAFVWRSFATLHPGREDEFVPAWHVEAMCQELENIRSGENRQLVINIPPRHLKSVTVAVAFVAFLLGHRPEAKVIVASYGADLARKHSEDCRRIMEAAWYRRIFPETRLALRGNTVDEIRTTQGGGRKSVSTGGAVTGHGADYIIVDDLMKAADAESEAELLRAQEFLEGTLMSRFNNPAEGRMVMIAQRLHEMDPPGCLLAKGTFRHLNLPAIAEQDEIIAIGGGRVHSRGAGEPLFPERMDLQALEAQRKLMGNAKFNCQYQQNPIAPDGSPLRWEWFGCYDEPQPRNQHQMIVQSWDTGMSADPRADYSVCTTWGFRNDRWWLLDLLRDRLDYPDLRKAVVRLADQWNADKVLIEKAASGIPLLQDLFPTHRSRYRAIQPLKDKEIRFAHACAPIEEGKVLLPREAPWLPDLRRELQGFPRSHHDDQVDSVSQFLNWSMGQGFWRSLDREHPLKQAQRARQRR